MIVKIQYLNYQYKQEVRTIRFENKMIQDSLKLNDKIHKLHYIIDMQPFQQARVVRS